MADIDYRSLLLEEEKDTVKKDTGNKYRDLLTSESTAYTPFSTIQQDIDWDELHKNDDWLRASQHFFNMTYGYVPLRGDKELEKYSGSTYREKLADYGLKQMAGFNYNLGDMTIDTNRVLKSDQTTKEAFVYMMDQYDAVNTSLHTMGQAGWEMFTDITNWAGLITMGTGTVAAQGARVVAGQAAKEAVKASLKNATKKSVEAAAKIGIDNSVKRAGAVAAVGGAGHAIASDAMMQNVRIDAGQQDEYSTAQTLMMGGIGGVAGGVLGSGLDYGLGKLARKYYDPKVKKLEEDTQKSEIAAGIIAEKRLAEAREVAGTPVAKAVDDEVPASQLELQLKEQVDAEVAGVTVPAAQLAKPLFKHAYHIFEDAQVSPEGAAKRIIEEFDHAVPDSNNLTKMGDWYSETKKQINAAAQLSRYDVERINGKLLDETLTAAEASVLKGDLVKAIRVGEQLNVVKAYVNAYSGRDLNDIKFFLDIKATAAKERGEKFDMVKIEKKVTREVYNRRLEKMLDEFDVEIDKALKDGNEKVARELREAKVEALNNPDSSVRTLMKEMEDLNIEDTVTVKPESSLDEKMLEAAISGVFSIPTLIYNTVYPAMKVAFFPMLDTLVTDPLNKMAWKKNLMVYSQMKGAMEAAWISARASTRYEQTMLTADLSRILEGGVKIDSLLGSAEAASFLRIFPRLVSASDAFQQEMAAVSSLTAIGFDRLAEKGLEQGLSGNKLRKFIDDNIEAEINKGYDFHLSMTKMKPIYELGTRKGLAGKELEDFVDAEVAKYGKGAFKTLGDDVTVADMRKEVSRLLKEGTEESHNLANVLAKEADEIERTGQEALNDVRTLLYKRDFNKEGGFAERLAAGYEDVTRHRAWSRFLGNLFFRTPAWLFHESMRLTPAVNQLLPQFRNDLSGVNGARAQARAKTEASIAYAWTLYVVTKYAMGEISGSANVDYTKTAEKNQSTLRPLNIKEPFFFENGEEVNFARFEPLRIPTTIIVNALDGYMEYQDQRNMDGIDPERLEGGIPDSVMASMGVAFATAISAFRDSALTQGITDTVGTAVKVSGLMESPEGEDKEKGMNLLGNFFLEKGLQVVPSSFKKMNEAIRGDAPIVQPRTIKHKVIASVNPYDKRLPVRFDALGFPMEREITYTQITGFGAAYPEDLANGRSKEHMEVLDYLAKLENLDFGNFTRQKTRDDRFPNKDLRSIEVEYNGQPTVLFNVMMQEMYKIPWLIPKLHELATDTKLELGSPLNKHTIGERVKRTRALLTEARNMGLDRAIRITGLRDQVKQREQFERMLQHGHSTNRENISLFE